MRGKERIVDLHMNLICKMILPSDFRLWPGPFGRGDEMNNATTQRVSAHSPFYFGPTADEKGGMKSNYVSATAESSFTECERPSDFEIG